ncbi:phage tail tape measure protein [Paenibacillus thailandensis]
MSGLNLEYIISATDDFTKTFSKFESGLKGLEKTASSFTAVGAGLTAFGVGVAGGLGAAIKTGAEFDAQMSKVKAISGATAEEFEAMRNQALELGSSTSKSASEIASGFQEMAAMGFNATEVMGAMPGIIAASEASGADMAQVASVMASTLNSFSMEATEATRVADILAKTANISAADITDMQYALKYAAPSANALGISLEELSAAIGTIVNSGMQGEQAGTTLRMALQRLVDPPKEAANAMRELGFSAIDSQGNFKSMATIIDEMGTSLNGMTQAQKLATLSTIFGTEAASGMLTLIGQGPAAFNEMTTALENSAGSSAEASAIMKDNLAGSLDQMKGSLESLAIIVSDTLTPAIRWMAEQITGLVEWFNGLNDSAQKVVIVAAALSAGLALIGGPLLMLIGFIPQIAIGFTSIITVAKTLGSVFSLLTTGPMGLIVLAIGALIAAGVLLYTHWDEVSAYAMKVWTALSDWFSSTLATIGQFFTDSWNYVKDLTVSVFNGIVEFFRNYWDIILGVFTGPLGLIIALVIRNWDEIKAKTAEIFTAVKDKLAAIWESIVGKVTEVIGTLKTNLLAKWEEIKTDAVEMGKNIMEGLIKGVKSMVSKTVETIKDAVGSAVQAAKDFLGINSPSRVFMELGGYTGEGFAVGLENMAKTVANAASSMSAAAVGGTGYSSSGTTSMASTIGTVAASASGATTIVINATYVDRDALNRFADEVSRRQGRLVGGSR